MEILLGSAWFRNLNIGLALDEVINFVLCQSFYFFHVQGLANEDDKYSIFYGERLPWWVKITATGNTGHASRFVEGTAVEQILAVSQRAMQFRKSQKDKLFGAGKHAGCAHGENN